MLGFEDIEVVDEESSSSGSTSDGGRDPERDGGTSSGDTGPHTPRCRPTSPFTNPRLLLKAGDGLNDRLDAFPHLSQNELVMLWMRNVEVNKWQPFISTRAATNEP